MLKKLVTFLLFLFFTIQIQAKSSCLETKQQDAAYIVKINLTCSNVKLIGSQKIDKGLTVSEFAKKYHTNVAINANFFWKDLTPIGLVVTNGKKWSKYGDTRARTLFTCDKQNRCNIENKGTVTPLNAKWQLVISGWHWFNMKTGKFECANSDKIGCVQSIFKDKHPRTVVGLSADRKILFLVVVEGRQLSYEGMTLDELGQLVKSQGIAYATNLDGGGSSVMNIDGKRLNKLPFLQGKERSVSNHLGIKVD